MEKRLTKLFRIVGAKYLFKYHLALFVVPVEVII